MINVSIVLYKHTPEQIQELVQNLRLSKLVKQIYLIDNSPENNPLFGKLPVIYIHTAKNLGYGAGHNIAIRKTLAEKTNYHLVLNPDIQLRQEILQELTNYMESDNTVGQVMPKVYYPNGEVQYLCKLLPKPSDLFLRRFLPSQWTKKSNFKFEMRFTDYDKTMEVPYLSGCFMFLRTKALEVSGIFDEHFFMYPEDIDLTRRIHQNFKTIFFPHVSIIHSHEKASYKNIKLLLIHISNIIRYFNKWGWCFDKERKRVNKEIVRQHLSSDRKSDESTPQKPLASIP